MQYDKCDTTSLRTRILEVLNRCFPYALPESAFLTEINIRLRPPAKDTDFIGQLKALQKRRLVAFITDEVSGERKWLITEAGLTAVRRLP